MPGRGLVPVMPASGIEHPRVSALMRRSAENPLPWPGVPEEPNRQTNERLCTGMSRSVAGRWRSRAAATAGILRRVRRYRLEAGRKEGRCPHSSNSMSIDLCSGLSAASRTGPRSGPPERSSPGSIFRGPSSDRSPPGTPFGQFRVVAPVEFTPRQMPGSGGRRSVVVRSRRRGELRHLDGPDRRMPDGRSGGDRMRLRTEES